MLSLHLGAQRLQCLAVQGLPVSGFAGTSPRHGNGRVFKGLACQRHHPCEHHRRARRVEGEHKPMSRSACIMKEDVKVPNIVEGRVAIHHQFVGRQSSPQAQQDLDDVTFHDHCSITVVVFFPAWPLFVQQSKDGFIWAALAQHAPYHTVCVIATITRMPADASGSFMGPCFDPFP